MDMPRFCKDCAHNTHPFMARVQGHSLCERPILTAPLNLVTGDPKRLGVSAHGERKPGKTLFGRERCGPEAKFFEQRPPMVPPTTGSAVPPPPHKG